LISNVEKLLPVSLFRPEIPLAMILELRALLSIQSVRKLYLAVKTLGEKASVGNQKSLIEPFVREALNNYSLRRCTGLEKTGNLKAFLETKQGKLLLPFIQKSEQLVKTLGKICFRCQTCG